MSRILAVGDIHGCLDKLKKLMDVIKWRPDEDTLIFIGDYVDRGPDSSGVIEYIIGLKKKSDRVICLMGNHETLFMDYLEGKENQVFLFNGGVQTLDSYGGMELEVPEIHMDFLHSLQPYYQTKNYIFVHAGLRNNIPLGRQSLKDLLWIREEFITSHYNHGRRVIFGHTPYPMPLVHDNKIGIDTGAVYGGELTCLELPGVIFYAV
jgi:serine/threonine protein phosphatase 1